MSAGDLLPEPWRTWWRRWRPLERIGSIKVKLGVLVVTSVAATALLTWYGLLVLDVWPRYTLPLAVVVSLGITQVLAHGMTRPLRQMTRAAADMAADRPATPVPVGGRDEVGELARAFVSMREDLAEAQARRRDLLANVAHELRTPVAALRAQVENLVDGVRPADAAALEQLLTTTDTLADLVEDLLDLARAEAGATPILREVVPVAPLLASCVAQVRQVRPDRSVTVEVPDGLTVDADEHRLRQVVVNLLDNATRHTPPGTSVEVRAHTGDDARFVLEVTDDGPGIPADQRESVFGRVQRGDGAGERGTGLGLAIARGAVARHGGRIGVVPAPGRGCRVRVEIPPP
ncbi:MAG: HAMP domain-containing sensor histidine kinase [Kineosporiaceae bacterium]